MRPRLPALNPAGQTELARVGRGLAADAAETQTTIRVTRAAKFRDITTCRTCAMWHVPAGIYRRSLDRRTRGELPCEK